MTPADTRHSLKVGLPLVQRRRQWTNVKTTLIQRLVSARTGINPLSASDTYIYIHRKGPYELRIQ